jgi:glycosyltransferase involved in cell wall biosynthesis
MAKLSIIIPAYNEKATIEKLVERIEQVGIDGMEKEIIIIDDGSNDGTKEILTGLENKYRIITNEENMGKGNAVRKGFQSATGDVLIIQDADLEYDPQDQIVLLAPIMQGRADVVYGSRFIGSKPHRVMFVWHYMGNRFLTMLSNLLTNLNLTDMETGYKAFNRKAIDKFKDKITSQRFGIEPELTALAAKNKLRICEVGVAYYGRTYEEGKKINWKDGLAAIWHIIYYNIFR